MTDHLDRIKRMGNLFALLGVGIFVLGLVDSTSGAGLTAQFTMLGGIIIAIGGTILWCLSEQNKLLYLQQQEISRKLDALKVKTSEPPAQF
ncbi:hypothetical protein HJC99_05040 [Candidatus Saccharibacteria bacterium]|nr:hypothetical protein [Candidatus Saccharibacteria bacterium]